MSCCLGMEVDYKGHREILRRDETILYLDCCGSHMAVYIYENSHKCKLRRVNFIYIYSKLESGKTIVGEGNWSHVCLLEIMSTFRSK